MAKSARNLVCGTFLKLTLLWSLAWGFPVHAFAEHDTKAEEAQAPNVLVIMADQWRRMALSLYRDNEDMNQGDPVRTPNIDRLAAEGVIYDNSYCCAPVCCPNRATLVTGKYPHTHGLTENKYADNFTYDNRTIAHILAERGYDTGFIGKWHLANHHVNQNKYLTEEQRRGFRYWYGNEMCHHHFDGIYCHAPEERDSLYSGKLPYLFTPSVLYSSEDQQREKWMPDHLSRKMVEYLGNTFRVRDATKPFLCYLSFSPPHSIHGPVPRDGEEESYSIAGKKFIVEDGRKKPETYGKQGRLKSIPYKVNPYSDAAPNEYRAPNAFEAAYREGGTYDGAPIDLGKRPNVSDHYYEHSITAYPGYFGAVNSLDENIGRVLEALRTTDDERNPGHKLIDNTIVVITSDHGEHLGSHDTMGKGHFWEESVGVPLVFYWKGKTAEGVHKKTLFNSVDLVPTLLGAVGVEIPEDIEGTDLSDDLASPDSGSDDGYVYMRLYQWAAIRHQQYVYAWDRRINRKPMLFDLENDPFQMHPILFDETEDETHAAMIKHLHEKLAAHLAAANDPLPFPPVTRRPMRK